MRCFAHGQDCLHVMTVATSPAVLIRAVLVVLPLSIAAFHVLGWRWLVVIIIRLLKQEISCELLILVASKVSLDDLIS